uniref:Zona pellucida glycoprotein 3c n=1 Tax=Acanthochromis polyacanthus TaxID=80966 RepID=A0A3Q1GJN0_9TELE
MKEMGLIHVGLLFLLFCLADSSRFRNRAGDGVFLQDPELEWERRATGMDEEKAEASVPKSKPWGSASVAAASLPGVSKYEYLHVPYANDRKEDFKPEKGARSLPAWAKKILLGRLAPLPLAQEAGDAHKLVEILCHVDRLYVRVKKEVFKSRDAHKYLKLGTCPVNRANDKYYFLLYLLKNDCGFKKESHVDYLSISNVLSYKPTSVVLRELPFDIPLQCKFPRLFYSYKIGFHPKLQGGTVFKALQPKKSGKDITGIVSYILGQPMFFQASAAVSTPGSGKERLYINKCFVTASQDPNSKIKYTVIDNYGCMIDGKVTSYSKYIIQYCMCCQIETISMGPLSPTPTSKACNFNPATKKWEALYGKDCICDCCSSTCSSAKPNGKFQPFVYTF